MPVRRDINFNSGFTGCEDRMAILKNETVQRDLSGFKELEAAEIDTNQFVYIDDNGKPAKIRLGTIIDTNAVQADWTDTDPESYAYIKNKPDIALDEDLVSIYNVGGVHKGDVFARGTSMMEIIKNILSSTSNDTGIRFGLLNEIPNWNTFNPESDLTIASTQTVASLLQYGFEVNFTANNQYYVLAVPATLGTESEDGYTATNVEVDSVLQNGFPLSFEKININIVNSSALWYIYLPTKETYPDNTSKYARTTGKFKITYTFKEVGV